MGFASYFEDNLAQFEERLESLSRELSKTQLQDNKIVSDLKRIRTETRNLLKKVKALADLATDPAIDLAHELLTLQSAHKEAQSKIQNLETELRRERKSSIDARSKLWRTEIELEATKKIVPAVNQRVKEIEKLKKILEDERNEYFINNIDNYLDMESDEDTESKETPMSGEDRLINAWQKGIK